MDDFLIKTMIPVRENSEIVIIYPHIYIYIYIHIYVYILVGYYIFRMWVEPISISIREYNPKNNPSEAFMA